MTAKIKTGLLLCLVLISAFLALQLMAGKAVPGHQVQYEEVWFGPEPALHEVVLPGRVYSMNSLGETYLFETFSERYNDLIATLGQIEYAQGGADWVSGLYRPSQEGTFTEGVLYRFEFQVSRELLVSWLTGLRGQEAPFQEIDSIFVPSDRGPVQFINTNTRETWELRSSLAWSVIENAVAEPRELLDILWVPMLSGGNYSVAPGVIEPSGPASIPIFEGIREEIYYNSLVRSFYLEPALTRLIQEPDGAEIYTDGFQALRIYPSGALEYTVVHQTGTYISGQADLVESSLGFVTAHGGWPRNMLATRMDVKAGGRVRLEFSSYGRGLPLMGLNTGIAVELNGLAVSHYNRNLILALTRSDIFSDNVEILPPSWHLSDPTTQAAQYMATLSSEITDLSLAYYWQYEKFVPVWRITLNNQVVVIGAADGRILNVKTPTGGE